MPLIPKPKYNQIFASQAPSIDNPAEFNNYPQGWNDARNNNGKPTIKQFNYLQQTSDLKALWILQNGACLPYDETIDYTIGAPVLLDSILQYKTADGFSPVNKETSYTLKYFISGIQYPLNAEIMLANGDTVQSTIANNTANPNVDMTGWVNTSLKYAIVENKTYPDLLGSPVRFRLNPLVASLVYGINDPTHLDDNLNNFRGLNNPDAWHISNIAIGGVAFGRNNVPFAYLSTALGHDCVGYGVASLVGGAGSASGNPDVPNDGANYGYCSLAVGKDTQARGRISNAMGERNISASRYSSTDGYGCIAGSQIAELEGDIESEGAAARAHGYKSEAYGNFSFSYGAFLKSFNGAQVLGRGINEGSTLNIRKRGLALGYNVDVPTIFCQSGSGVNGAQAQIGFNTEQPISKYDFRFKNSEVTSYVIDNLGFGAASFDVVGLLNGGSYGSLYKVVTTHANAGQPYGTTTFWQNNIKVMSMDQVGNLAISPKTTANPTNNGDLVFELTSNTQLKIKLKGSDGVVRSVALTLA